MLNMTCARVAGTLLWAAVMFVRGQSVCEPGLVQPLEPGRTPAAKDLSYQERDNGNRCEGLYARPEGGRAELPLLSLVRSFPDLDLHAVPALEVSWSAPGPARVSLRGNSLRYKVYYRMDAAARPNENRFSWPASVLKNVDLLRSRELGVLAWIDSSVPGSNRPVYLPVRVTAPGADERGARLEAVVVPTAELSELFVTLEFKASSAARTVRLYADKPLGQAAYPPEKPVRVPITSLAAAGYYHVTLRGSLAGGGSVPADFWFYNAGN